MTDSSDAPENLNNERIIFFDGVCNLCNVWVDFVIRRDRNRYFKMASLQGETAQILMKDSPYRTNLLSVVLWDQGHIAIGSDAVLAVLRELPNWKWLGYVGHFFPGFLRQFIYHWIAEHRYKLIGQRSSCRLPTKDEQLYFLP